MPKRYGIFHVSGFRSENYPLSYDSAESARGAIGAGLSAATHLLHSSKYVVKELIVDPLIKDNVITVAREYVRNSPMWMRDNCPTLYEAVMALENELKQ